MMKKHLGTILTVALLSAAVSAALGLLLSPKPAGAAYACTDAGRAYVTPAGVVIEAIFPSSARLVSVSNETTLVAAGDVMSPQPHLVLPKRNDVGLSTLVGHSLSIYALNQYGGIVFCAVLPVEPNPFAVFVPLAAGQTPLLADNRLTDFP